MGDNRAVRFPALPPAPTAVTLTHPMFVFDHQVTLRLMQKWSHMDTFDVCDTEGTLFFRVQNDREAYKSLLLDVDGRVVANVRLVVSTFSVEYQTSLGDSAERIVMHSKPGAKLIKRKTEHRFIDAASGNSTKLQTVMNSMRHDGDVLLADRDGAFTIRLAHIQRPFPGKSEYFVTIAAGVDAALMCLLCVIHEQDRLRV